MQDLQTSGALKKGKQVKIDPERAVLELVDPFGGLESVDIAGLRLPANVMLSNGEGAVVIGRRYSTPLGLGGTVSRIRWMVREAYYVVDVAQGDGKTVRYALLTQSGMEGVVK